VLIKIPRMDSASESIRDLGRPGDTPEDRDRDRAENGGKAGKKAILVDK
jgi:hypothetical protein